MKKKRSPFILLASLSACLLILFLDKLSAQENKKPNPANLNVPCDVWSISLTKDARFLAAGAGWWNQPGEIGIWDLATRKPLQRLVEERGIASVAFSPDGKLLASGSWSGQARVYDWAKGMEVADLPVNSVARVAFSPDGKLLATASENKRMLLWDVANNALVAELEGDLFRFQCVAFAPNGERVLAGGGDWKKGGVNLALVWDMASKEQVLKLTGHDNAIICASYSPDGKIIATGSTDKTIRFWDPASGRNLKILQGHNGGVESVVFSADGKTLISASHDHTIRYWDVDNGRETGRIEAMSADVRAVLLTPDATTLIAGGGRKTLKIFEVSSHQELAALWNDADPQKASMDDLPVATSPKTGGRLFLIVFCGLGLLGLVLLALKRLHSGRQQRP